MNNLIEQVLVEQNPHWTESLSRENQFERLCFSQTTQHLALEEIQIVTGIRRCGKSTLLQNFIQHLQKTQDPKTIFYLNLDDPNYTELKQDPRHLYTLVTSAEKLTKQKIQYLFLDEIQNVSGWESYVKSVYDRRRFKKIVVTGSNSALLNSDYANLLSGRYLETRLYPLSYRELLLPQGIDTPLLLNKYPEKALALVDSMLQMGGFPRVHCVEAKTEQRQLLQSYYETILLKDCMQTQKIRDTKTFSELTHYLMSNLAAPYSYNNLAKAIGSNENTVQQFIHTLENVYLLQEVKPFSYSLKTQTKAKKKIYCIDNGLVSSVAFQVSANHGKLFENLVYTELKKQGGEIYYSPETKECDFIWRKDRASIAIQVCYDLTATNRSREIDGLLQTMEKWNIPKGVLITYNQAEKISPRCDAIPFWKFFLDPLTVSF